MSAAKHEKMLAVLIKARKQDQMLAAKPPTWLTAEQDRQVLLTTMISGAHITVVM